MSSLKLPGLVYVLYVPVSPSTLCLSPKGSSFFLLHYIYTNREMVFYISDYMNYSVS